jgi:hypothetical protein
MTEERMMLTPHQSAMKAVATPGGLAFERLYGSLRMRLAKTMVGMEARMPMRSVWDAGQGTSVECAIRVVATPRTALYSAPGISSSQLATA